MHGHARHDLVVAVVEGNAAGKHLAHHGDDIVGLERQPQRLMAHTAAGRIGHLAILQVIAGARKQLVIAAMIVVKMTDNDARHRIRRDAERGKTVSDRLGDLALAAAAHRLVEAGIDNDRAGRADDRPDEEIQRLQHIVRIAADEVLRRATRMMPIADGINLVHVLAHASVLLRPFVVSGARRSLLPSATKYRGKLGRHAANAAFTH